MSIEILAGSYGKGRAELTRLGIKTKDGTIAFGAIDSVAVATEANVKKLSGTLKGGILGGVLFGPLGAIGGILLGGNKKEITFIILANGDEQFLARSDGDTFTKIAGFAMDNSIKAAKIEKDAARERPKLEELLAVPCWSCGRLPGDQSQKRCGFCKAEPVQAGPPCWNCGRRHDDLSKLKCSYCK